MERTDPGAGRTRAHRRAGPDRLRAHTRSFCAGPCWDVRPQAVVAPVRAPSCIPNRIHARTNLPSLLCLRGLHLWTVNGLLLHAVALVCRHVRGGDAVCRSGSVGFSPEPHLHLEAHPASVSATQQRNTLARTHLRHFSCSATLCSWYRVTV